MEEKGTLPLLRIGDPKALAAMMTEYGDRLLRAAYGLCRDRAQAQDLVQETFCRVIPALGRYRGDGLLFTWLYSVMRNLFLKNVRRQRLFSLFSQTAGGVPVSPGPERHAVAEEERGLLSAALERLPARQREVLLLRFSEEMRLGEIAAALKISRGTVKSRLHNALKRLRRSLPSGGLAGIELEVDHDL
ncbi:MAG: sigma-70 family RNA polymerase sigma factor [Candidatus Aminicenantes bacterium]|nr:sigma-70 family RNA polymerase sigma factor [Candidatus Aminicenantes bacterium]